MTEYSVEEISAEIGRLRKGGVADAGVIRMLTDYADLREQIERAREGLTDEVVDRACSIYFGDLWPDEVEEFELCRTFMRAALKAVAHLLPSGVRDAYEGAREDLLDWKGRAQRSEARLRALGYTGIDASEAPNHPPAQAAQVDKRVFRGVGELERSGYIDAAEPVVQVGAPDINDHPYECGFDNGLEQGALRFMRWILANKPYATPGNTGHSEEPAINRWYRDFVYSGAAKATTESVAQQATTCAGCGKYKPTPLRIDAMGGYVCLTCIDEKLSSLLGEFGYPEGPAAQGEAKCPECNGDGYNWLPGAPAHHDNQLKCDRCGGTGVIHLIAVPELVVQGEAVYDLAMHLACEHGETDESGTGYCFSMEQLDAFIHAFVAAQPRAVPDEFIEDIQRAERLALRSKKLNRERMMGLAVLKHLGHLLAAAPSPGEQS